MHEVMFFSCYSVLFFSFLSLCFTFRCDVNTFFYLKSKFMRNKLKKKWWFIGLIMNWQFLDCRFADRNILVLFKIYFSTRRFKLHLSFISLGYFAHIHMLSCLLFSFQISTFHLRSE